MDAAQAKDRFFEDYVTWFRILWPEAQGFYCYDRRGQLFWRDPGEVDCALNDGFRAALASCLRQADDGVTVPLSGGVEACLFALRGQGGTLNGVLAVISDQQGVCWADCEREMGPALRGLQRELDLRCRLVDVQRKLRVQSAEEKLLHHVETVVHQRLDSRITLEKILGLVREHLGLQRVALVVAGKGIRMLDADDGLTGPKAQLALESMIVAAEKDQDDQVVLPVDGVAGRLILAGWPDSGFSGRRRRRIGRYLVSNIESVLERDFDPLTGLMTWPVFEGHLKKACEAFDPERYVLMFMDIDQLHVINENYGRLSGDEVIEGFGRMLHHSFDGSPVARISADGFAVLLVDIPLRRVQEQAEQVCRRFRKLEFGSAGRTFQASVSIGLVSLDNGVQDASSGLAMAQVASRAAKDRGAGRVEVYQAHDKSIVQRLDDIQQVSKLREAIRDDRLILLGQPIRDLRGDRSLSYLEVLVRMIDEGGRQLSPSEFLSAAERYQFMDELDRRVVERSLAALKESPFYRSGAPVRLSINLSGQSLGNEQFLDFVQQCIEDSGVAPELLCFEITETVAVNNMQYAQAFMHQLRRIGCHFSLDDFGTGLSSFAYLKLFPVDTLKIDGSFIRDMATNVVSQSVVAAISEVARVMKLDTVAEYVQDKATLELLRGLGVTWGQGYYFGEPAPLAEVLQVVHDDGASRSVANV